MNRFFSKLDLRDIKIDPTGTRFPPDAEEDEAEVDEEPVPTPNNGQETAPAATEPTQSSHTPAWASERAPEASYHGDARDLHQPVATDANAAPSAETAVDAAVDGASRSGEVLKVSARSRPSAVAGAIAGVVRESGRAEVQAIGAGATNQAVKAVAIARDYLRETGIEAICLPAFIDVTIDNEDRTAIRLVVEPR